jgi:hypothetical protein
MSIIHRDPQTELARWLFRLMVPCASTISTILKYGVQQPGYSTTLFAGTLVIMLCFEQYKIRKKRSTFKLLPGGEFALYIAIAIVMGFTHSAYDVYVKGESAFVTVPSEALWLASTFLTAKLVVRPTAESTN